jgi:acetate kinase
MADRETLFGTVEVEGIGSGRGRLLVRGADKRVLDDVSDAFDSHADAEHALFEAFDARAWPAPQAIGHRIVHGGRDHGAPELVDARLIATLRALIAFAPLHLPAGISGIEAASRRFPDLPQVVCFDTAFHRRMPELAQWFPLPRALWDLGVRRYGFHGLSYEYVVHALGPEALGRAIIAHLGNGASMAALRDGQPLDTSMGFTPSGGLMMSTRSGDLDPGLALHLLNARGYDAASLERLVDHEAGLLGVSGLSADMRTLLQAREHNAWAAQAVDLFCYQIRKQIGAYSAVLGGLDTVVFTGGIGEHAALVREAACAGLAYLGIELDPDANQAHAAVISRPGSGCVVRVLATDEDRMIARHTSALVGARDTDHTGDTGNTGNRS